MWIWIPRLAYINHIIDNHKEADHIAVSVDLDQPRQTATLSTPWPRSELWTNWTRSPDVPEVKGQRLTEGTKGQFVLQLFWIIWLPQTGANWLRSERTEQSPAAASPSPDPPAHLMMPILTLWPLICFFSSQSNVHVDALNETKAAVFSRFAGEGLMCVVNTNTSSTNAARK